jgi:hypothetical protein
MVLASVPSNPLQEFIMKLSRILFIALAIVLPASWTIAKAGDEAPSSETKTTKKSKKSKKADGTSEEKTETKTEKTDKK